MTADRNQHRLLSSNVASNRTRKQEGERGGRPRGRRDDERLYNTRSSHPDNTSHPMPNTKRMQHNGQRRAQRRSRCIHPPPIHPSGKHDPPSQAGQAAGQAALGPLPSPVMCATPNSREASGTRRMQASSPDEVAESPRPGLHDGYQRPSGTKYEVGSCQCTLQMRRRFVLSGRRTP